MSKIKLDYDNQWKPRAGMGWYCEWRKAFTMAVENGALVDFHVVDCKMEYETLRKRGRLL